jgi:hypothetical protein
MSVMFAVLASNVGPAFIIWSLFDIVVFAIPLGIVGAFPSSLVWWILMRRLQYRVTGGTLICSFSGALVAAAAGYLYWSLFPFGGSPWVAAVVWGAVSLTLYWATGKHLINKGENTVA